MPRVLSLETSTAICSAALHENGKLIVTSAIHEEQSHASRLAVLIDQLFDLAGWAPSSLNAVAVSSGPGSYTGLRIGTATAKGLCFSLQIPLVAVDTLSVMVRTVLNKRYAFGHLCPMLDARRMEVYCALYTSDGSIVSPVASLVVDQNSFSDMLSDHVVCFFGPGAEKCADVIKSANARFLANVLPSAVELGELAHQKLVQGQLEDVVNFEPIYLKEFVAKKSVKIDGVLNK